MNTLDPPITRFDGHFKFLSNFYRADIFWHNLVASTAEHAFQAEKTEDSEWRKRILFAPTPALAKKLGKQAPRVPNWERIKLDVMKEVLQAKFSSPVMRELLLSTKNSMLVEGNSWGDTFWGQCPVGTGENWLGKLLMQIREELRGQAPQI